MNSLRQLAVILCAMATLTMTSCDKVKDLADSAKDWISDEENADGGDQFVEVQSVGKTEGQEIISNESRLVIVEYYSDT